MRCLDPSSNPRAYGMNQAFNRTSPDQPVSYPLALLNTARKNPALWVIPLFSALLIAVLSAYLGPKKWDATQSFVVREELIGRIVSPGRFDSLESMTTAQQVIQETARRPVVLERVYQQVEGRPPTREDIEGLRDSISFQAPGGSELGKTEILTMRVEADTPQKAIQLVEVLFEQTRQEIRAIRQTKAESMLTEVKTAVDLADERLTSTTEKLRRIENEAGRDLSELRGLNDAFSGGSDLRRQVSALQTEIRRARLSEERATQLIESLSITVNDPLELLATPRELLESQPALSELKNQLIEAQVIQSNVLGVYSAKHPRHISAVKSVAEIRTQIKQELETTLVGLKAQQSLAQQEIAGLEKQAREYERRISKVANMRVDYGQLVSEIRLRNEELAAVHKEYAQAVSILRAAENVDFMSRLDEAMAGLYPLGPSKKTLVLGAGVVGVLIGFGIVMMLTPPPVWVPPTEPGNRSSKVSASSPHLPTLSEAQAAKATAQTSTASVSPVPGFVIPDLGQALSDRARTH